MIYQKIQLFSYLVLHVQAKQLYLIIVVQVMSGRNRWWRCWYAAYSAGDHQYERSDYALLETLLGSGSLAEALNKADYVEQIAAYDRKKLDEYEATRIKVQ